MCVSCQRYRSKGSLGRKRMRKREFFFLGEKKNKENTFSFSAKNLRNSSLDGRGVLGVSSGKEEGKEGLEGVGVVEAEEQGEERGEEREEEKREEKGEGFLC